MQIETIGPYQLHLIAHELSSSGKWAPYVEIHRFDERMQDFKCVFAKHHASDRTFPNYEAAIEQARRTGTAIIASKENELYEGRRH